MERAPNPSRGGLPLLGLVGGVLLAGAVSGLCFLYLWQGNRIQELTAAAEEAREQLEMTQGINRILDVRIDEAFSLERIARLARERLGMSEPTIIRYVSKPIEDTD
jgi:hypothetical protein